MTNKLSKIYKEHKVFTFLTVVAVLIGAYYVYKAKTSTTGVASYSLGKVERGALVVSISGSGQISASNQVDIVPKISSNVVSINVKEGQSVKTGDVLARLDNKDLAVQAQEAKNSLDIAQANLNLKLAGPTTQDIAISQKSVDSAKAAYETSVANLNDTKRTVQQNLKKSKLSLSNAQVAADNAQKSYNNTISSQNVSSDTSNQSLTNAYDNAKPTISSTLVNLRTAVSSADNILGIDHNTAAAYKYLLGVAYPQSVNDAANSFATAKQSLASFEQAYQAASANWSQSGEDGLLNQSLSALQDMKTMVHNTYTVLLNTITGTDLSQSTLDSYKQSMSSQESSLVSNINSIQGAIQNIADAKLGLSSSGISSSSSIDNAKAALATAQNNLMTAQSNLEQTQSDNQNSIDSAQADVNAKKISYESSVASYDLKVAKPRPVDIQAMQAQITQAQNAYQLSLDNLNNANIISPIDGLVAKVYLNVGDSAAPANPVVTVITPRQLATITLNEVDAAKVKPGQKATLTFNAIDGLTITGSVTNIDAIGTVSQGVVNYTAKIALDTQDQRVKSQMTVSANIITNENLNTLIMPNSAVKTDASGGSYVEVLNNSDIIQTSTNNSGNNAVSSINPPSRKSITVGLSNDTDTEVLNGLSEGDSIIVRALTTGNSSQTSSSQPANGLRLFGGGGGAGAGGAFRAGGGGGRGN